MIMARWTRTRWAFTSALAVAFLAGMGPAVMGIVGADDEGTRTLRLVLLWVAVAALVTAVVLGRRRERS